MDQRSGRRTSSRSLGYAVEANGLLTSTRNWPAAWLGGYGIEMGTLHQLLTEPTGCEVPCVDRVSEPGPRSACSELTEKMFGPMRACA